MDFLSQKLGLKLIKKTSSRGIQFFIITHQKGVSDYGDKWYGISSSEKGCLVENISCLDSKKFLGLKP
jgi:chromosome segregation ATPase